MDMNNLQNETTAFRYQMLARMQSDCKYYLDLGNRNKDILWSKNEKKQIENMQLLYNSFSESEKPHWISQRDIDEYELQMVLYTWDELCERADGSACGDPKLRAKDNAREILTVIIEKETGICIDDLEIPEEGIDDYLINNPGKYLFNSCGNLITPYEQ